MTFYEKTKLWLLATGLKNLGWGAAFIAAFLFGWTFTAGVCGGIFVNLNWNVLVKLYKGVKL